MECRNVGTTDQIIRVLIALALILFSISYAQAYFTWISILVVLIILTVLFQWCPIYAILGINTCEVSVEKKVEEAKKKTVVGQVTKSKKAAKKTAKKATKAKGRKSEKRKSKAKRSRK